MIIMFFVGGRQRHRLAFSDMVIYLAGYSYNMMSRATITMKRAIAELLCLPSYASTRLFRSFHTLLPCQRRLETLAQMVKVLLFVYRNFLLEFQIHTLLSRLCTRSAGRSTKAFVFAASTPVATAMFSMEYPI